MVEAALFFSEESEEEKGGGSKEIASQPLVVNSSWSHFQGCSSQVRRTVPVVAVFH
jgi:hypothetical protein